MQKSGSATVDYLELALNSLNTHNIFEKLAEICNPLEYQNAIVSAAALEALRICREKRGDPTILKRLSRDLALPLLKILAHFQPSSSSDRGTIPAALTLLRILVSQCSKWNYEEKYKWIYAKETEPEPLYNMDLTQVLLYLLTESDRNRLAFGDRVLVLELLMYLHKNHHLATYDMYHEGVASVLIDIVSMEASFTELKISCWFLEQFAKNWAEPICDDGAVYFLTKVVKSANVLPEAKVYALQALVELVSHSKLRHSSISWGELVDWLFDTVLQSASKHLRIVAMGLLGTLANSRTGMESLWQAGMLELLEHVWHEFGACYCVDEEPIHNEDEIADSKDISSSDGKEDESRCPGSSVCADASSSKGEATTETDSSAAAHAVDHLRAESMDGEETDDEGSECSIEESESGSEGSVEVDDQRRRDEDDEDDSPFGGGTSSCMMSHSFDILLSLVESMKTLPPEAVSADRVEGLGDMLMHLLNDNMLGVTPVITLQTHAMQALVSLIRISDEVASLLIERGAISAILVPWPEVYVGHVEEYYCTEAAWALCKVATAHEGRYKQHLVEEGVGTVAAARQDMGRSAIYFCDSKSACSELRAVLSTTSASSSTPKSPNNEGTA